MKHHYLADSEEWKRLAKYISKNGAPIGLDSEFDGVNFKAGDSCVNRARIHVWSLAVSDGVLTNQGYLEDAVGVVLPSTAIDAFRGVLENPAIVKFAHNSSVDVHAFYNSGVDVQGVVNTLGLARWVLPDRLIQSLDSLGRDLLGVGKFLEYNTLVDVMKWVEVVIGKDCACGENGCRKRKLPTHEKTPTVELVEKIVGRVELASITPGHHKWDLLVEYAAQDAVLALKIGYLLSVKAARKDVDVPWLK